MVPAAEGHQVDQLEPVILPTDAAEPERYRKEGMDGWGGGVWGEREEDVRLVLCLMGTKWEREKVHPRLWERGGAFLADQCRWEEAFKTHLASIGGLIYSEAISITSPLKERRICVTRAAGASDTSGDRCRCLQPAAALYHAKSRCANERSGWHNLWANLPTARGFSTESVIGGVCCALRLVTRCVEFIFSPVI